MQQVNILVWQCLQIGPLQQKLVKLQSGSILITKEEREAVEKVAAASFEACHICFLLYPLSHLARATLAHQQVFHYIVAHRACRNIWTLGLSANASSKTYGKPPALLTHAYNLIRHQYYLLRSLRASLTRTCFMLPVQNKCVRCHAKAVSPVSASCKTHQTWCFLLDRGDISENVDQNQKEVFEEMGVQTDEDVEVSHEAFSKLQTKRRRT